MENKWEGKVSTILPSTKADQIWPLFKDFFNLHKWFHSLSTCYGIHGTNGEPGCIRYCLGSSASSIPPSKGSDQKINGEEVVSWSKERLIAVDEVNKSLSYELLDSNIGFKSYVATIRISPTGGGDDDDQDGCMIEWVFTVGPVQGLTFEDLVKKYEVALQRMAKNMEEAIKTSDTKL